MHFVDITMFYAAEGGGVSTYLNAKAQWLASNSNVRHTIASPNVRDCDGVPALRAVPGYSFPGINGYRMPRSVGACARVLRRLQPQLVEAGDAGHAAWTALRLKRQLGIPAIAFYHSDLPRLLADRFGPRAGRGAGAYLARLYRQFDLVMAPSRLMVQQLARLGVPGALHQPLGIDAGVFCPARRDDSLRDRLRLPPEARLLVYAGRFTPEKKLGLLLDAARMLGHPYHLLLVGGGCALPDAPHVSILPFRRDQRQLARLLASCDLLVHPGDCETFGLIVLEAMACGLPVLGTRGGAVAELVDDSTGRLVEPNSAPALAAGIDALFRSDRARLGEVAACKARAHYDWSAIMPQLMGRYASVLAYSQRAELEAGTVCVTD
jgi:alpha-1,6-mannosyltransferase